MALLMMAATAEAKATVAAIATLRAAALATMAVRTMAAALQR
jgi:hypothetical protein